MRNHSSFSACQGNIVKTSFRNLCVIIISFVTTHCHAFTPFTLLLLHPLGAFSLISTYTSTLALLPSLSVKKWLIKIKQSFVNFCLHAFFFLSSKKKNIIIIALENMSLLCAKKVEEEAEKKLLLRFNDI